MGCLLAPERGQFAPQVGHAVLGVGVAPQDEFHASSRKFDDLSAIFARRVWYASIV
jgi:hypothetical protein